MLFKTYLSQGPDERIIARMSEARNDNNASSSDVAAQLQTQRSFFGICWHHPVANDPSATAEH